MSLDKNQNKPIFAASADGGVAPVEFQEQGDIKITVEVNQTRFEFDSGGKRYIAVAGNGFANFTVIHNDSSYPEAAASADDIEVILMVLDGELSEAQKNRFSGALECLLTAAQFQDLPAYVV